VRATEGIIKERSGKEMSLSEEVPVSEEEQFGFV